MGNLRLLKIKKIHGEIRLLSGLHIGGGKDTIEIGGIDAPVIKNHCNGDPYIPGSSLKGKLRCLLEYHLGKIEGDGSVWGSARNGRYQEQDSDPIFRIFGTTLKGYRGGPTRISVRDALLDPRWRDRILDRGLLLTEEKAEVSIDRIKGKARDGGLRHIERVPAGAVFGLDIGYKVFDMGDGGKADRENINHLFFAMKLLEQDALGGSGSRGYGRLRFEALELDGESIQDAFEQIDIEAPCGKTAGNLP